MGFYIPEYVRVAGYQVGLGDQAHAKAEGIDQLQGVAGQLQIFFQGVVGVAHGAGAYYCWSYAAPQVAADGVQGVCLAPQVVAEDFQGVFFYFDRVEVRVLKAAAPAVAVDATMGAAPVEVHIIVKAEPGVRAVGFEYYVFGWDGGYGHGVTFNDCIG